MDNFLKVGLLMKKTLTKTIIEKKEFSYKNGNCNLGFTLRVDNSSELRDFHSCLEAALRDIDELLKGMKN